MSDPILRLNAALEGRYVVERELGEGGMATVYLAQDLKHERKVALKVLKPELAAVVGAERFLGEIKTTANLQHPHILPLFDSGEADSFLFYVMPYVEGETLRDRLEREKPLPVDEAIRIAADVAEALHAAHKQGVIHRDIKPANILLTDGRPLVADFGIALAVSTAGGERLTETGLSMGTPFYMSPEQASADREPSAASDVYSLGCVLYEMLVGEPPHVGATAQAVLAKILVGETPAPTTSRAAIPTHVDAAILKALERLPADRFSGAQAFAAALADPGFRHGDPVGIGTAAVKAGVWKPLTMVFASLFLLASAVAVWPRLDPTEAPVSRFTIDLPVVAHQSAVAGSNIALSPDGTHAVHVGEGPSGPQLWRKPLGDLRATPLDGTLGGSSPVFSPNGQSVAFAVLQSGSIKVVSLAGGAASTIEIDGGDGSGGEAGLGRGRDDYLYAPMPAGLGRVPVGGGKWEPFTSLDTARNETGHFWPQVLPDGRAIVFTVPCGSYREERHGIALADSGHLPFVTPSGTLMAAPFDREPRRLGDPVPVVEGVASGLYGSVHLAVSGDGTLMYTEGGQAESTEEREFVWVRRSGDVDPLGGETIRWSTRDYHNGLRLDPDSKEIAFTDVLVGDAALDVWTKRLPDGGLSRIAFGEAGVQLPSWRPDGQAVTFGSLRTFDLKPAGRYCCLWTVAADGAAEPEFLYGAPGDRYSGEGVWSPDGEWLVVRWNGTPFALHALRPGDDDVAAPIVADPQFNYFYPAISPDGLWLAYTSDERGRLEVFVRPFPDVAGGGRWQVSGAGGMAPVWAHNGRELLFVNPETSELVAADFTTTEDSFQPGSATPLFSVGGLAPPDFAHRNDRFYDVSLDDQQFLMTRAVNGETVAGPATTILVQNFFEELRRLAPGAR